MRDSNLKMWIYLFLDHDASNIWKGHCESHSEHGGSSEMVWRVLWRERGLAHPLGPCEGQEGHFCHKSCLTVPFRPLHRLIFLLITAETRQVTTPRMEVFSSLSFEAKSIISPIVQHVENGAQTDEVIC